MNSGDRGGQVREREALSRGETVSSGGPSGERRAARSPFARRVMVDATLALVVVLVALAMLGGVRLLELRQRALYPGSQQRVVVPAYQFIWRAAAPGSFTAEQAYAAEGRVSRNGDGADVLPVAALWVAQSPDAALVVVQLDPEGRWLAVVPIVRSGGGSSAVWQASAGTWPTSQHCGAAAVGGMCGESTVHSPAGNPLPELWNWSAADGTVGVAARFVEPLAAPATGGTLAGLALSVGSATVADGSTVVAVGTASAAAMQQQAQRLAASA